jgi:hypothetical protein
MAPCPGGLLRPPLTLATHEESDGWGVQTKQRWIPVGSVVSGGGGEFPVYAIPPPSGRAECLAGFSEVWVFNADANVQLVDP